MGFFVDPKDLKSNSFWLDLSTLSALLRHLRFKKKSILGETISRKIAKK
jgi:hypothetical protein